MNAWYKFRIRESVGEGKEKICGQNTAAGGS